MSKSKEKVYSLDSLSALLLTLIALSGEFPTDQIVRLPSTGAYKEKVIKSLKNGGLIRTYYRDGLRGLRLTAAAKKQLAADWPDRFSPLFIGDTMTNAPKYTVSHRLRLHRMAEVLVMMLNAGVSTFPWQKPIIFTPTPLYDKKTDAGYYGSCKARSEFYKQRDMRKQFQCSKEFLALFHDWDREAARPWLEKNYPPEKPTEVFRDTGGSLFSTVIRLAKASGDFARAEAILDYYLPCEHEEGRKEGVKLTAYEFSLEPILNYGSEGIYIDCYLSGKFNESGRSSLHVGTLKTLRRDLEAEKIMGELCGILHYYENQYVNKNLRRYTPDKELEAEYQRQLEQEEAKGDGKHE